MLESLAQGDRSVSELWGDTEMKLPSFMKHVRVLEDAGLVATEKSGRTRLCQLRPERLNAVRESTEFGRRLLDEQLESLGEYLAGQSPEP